MGRLTTRDKHEPNIFLVKDRGFDIYYTPEDRDYEAISKLNYLEDLEEQGLLIELGFNQYKRDALDRCTHRHCNNCDKYRRELQHYKDLEEQGRLIELPCAVGEEVWEIEGVIWKGYDWKWKSYEKAYPRMTGFTLDMLTCWGVDYFATEEEAQAEIEHRKLKELEGVEDGQGLNR